MNNQRCSKTNQSQEWGIWGKTLQNSLWTKKWLVFFCYPHSLHRTQYGFASIGGSSHKKITTIFFCSRKVREIHVYLGCLSTELSFSCDSIPSLSNLTGFERKKLLNQVEVEFMLSEPICQTHWWFDKDCLWINWENGLTPY